jgi:hypothetical protein
MRQWLKELRRAWKQAIKEDAPSVVPKKVLSRLEKKYRAMSKQSRRVPQSARRLLS